MQLFLPVFVFTIVIFAVVAALICWVEKSAERHERGHVGQ